MFNLKHTYSYWVYKKTWAVNMVCDNFGEIGGVKKILLFGNKIHVFLGTNIAE